jgi:hypothetical protein
MFAIALVLTLAAVVADGQTGTMSGPRTNATLCNDRQAIESYTRSLDAKIKTFPHRTFGKPFSEESKWTEVSGDHEGDFASIFTDGRKPVVAVFTFSSESADWVLEATYYFRADGTLAKKHEVLNTFYGNASVTRDGIFTCSGEVLFKVTRHGDWKTEKEKAPEPEFIDEESPPFKQVEDLPFFGLLTTRKR